MVREDEGEYELIPVAPMRRLEKRLDRLEESSVFDSRGIFKEVINIVRMNQQLVDELAKSSDALRIELAKLPGKLDELITNLKDLISFIKTSGEEEAVGVTQEAFKPLVNKLDEMVKTNKMISEKNDSMLELLDTISRKLKSPTARPMPMRRLLTRPTIPSTQPLKTTKPIKI
jgi:hypothetical protein